MEYDWEVVFVCMSVRPSLCFLYDTIRRNSIKFGSGGRDVHFTLLGEFILIDVYKVYMKIILKSVNNKKNKIK